MTFSELLAFATVWSDGVLIVTTISKAAAMTCPAMALATVKSPSALNRCMLMFCPSTRPFALRASSTPRTPSSNTAVAECWTIATRGILPPTDLRWCQSEISSVAEARRIRLNPNNSLRITVHIFWVSKKSVRVSPWRKE
jgi:hypothetical protein